MIESTLLVMFWAGVILVWIQDHTNYNDQEELIKYGFLGFFGESFKER